MTEDKVIQHGDRLLFNTSKKIYMYEVRWEVMEKPPVIKVVGEFKRT